MTYGPSASQQGTRCFAGDHHTPKGEAFLSPLRPKDSSTEFHYDLPRFDMISASPRHVRAGIGLLRHRRLAFVYQLHGHATPADICNTCYFEMPRIREHHRRFGHAIARSATSTFVSFTPQKNSSSSMRASLQDSLMMTKAGEARRRL